MTYKDKTYCASPNCKNKCGRKMSDEETRECKRSKFSYVSMMYFCDDKGEVIKGEKND